MSSNSTVSLFHSPAPIFPLPFNGALSSTYMPSAYFVVCEDIRKPLATCQINHIEQDDSLTPLLWLYLVDPYYSFDGETDLYKRLSPPLSCHFFGGRVCLLFVLVTLYSTQPGTLHVPW